MNGKREMVVMNATSLFREPLDREEADTRIETLRVDVLQLEALQRDKHVREACTGRRLTTSEYYTWKEQLRIVLSQKRGEIDYLTQWLKLKGGGSMHTHQVKAVTAFRLLWRCDQLMRRLVATGVALTTDEQRLLVDIAEFTAPKAGDLLAKARACIPGGSEPFFQFGGLIALATRDDQDLTALTIEWEKISSGRPRDELLISKCGGYYARVLAQIGRCDEAVAIAQSLDRSHHDTAYAWASIARYSNDAGLLEHARELGRNLTPEHQPWFFVRLYEFTGNREDAEIAERTELLGKKAAWYSVLLVKAHLSWGGSGRGTSPLYTSGHG